MSSSIKVTPEQLAQLATQASRTSQSIEGNLGSLSKSLGPLVAGEWGGQAAGQFASLWQEWHSSASRLNTALLSISQLLNQAGRAYSEAESSIAGTFRK